jgi:hypothetical protein
MYQTKMQNNFSFWIQFIHILQYFLMNHSGGVMVGVLVSSAVDPGF